MPMTRARLRALKAEKKRAKQHKTLRIFKTASGWRWIGVSSTAYRDRDGEIVSQAALRQAVADADRTGERGDLRFWHEPSLSLGTCDFQAISESGRLLIESGLFHSPDIAQKVAAQAGRLGLSIGFYHPLNEPDRERVFSHIAIFERSLAPRERVSNRFTQFHTMKEDAMPISKEKEHAARALFGENWREHLQFVESADKAAAESGTAYKADATPLAEITMNGVRYRAVEDAPVDLMAADVAVEEDLAEDEAIEDEASDAEEPLLTPADITAIADAVAARVMDMVDAISNKMSEIDNQMKGYGYTRQKAETDLAALKTEADARTKEIADLRARLATLEGEQPSRGFRASVAPETVVSQKTDAPASTDPIAAASAWLWSQ